MYLKCREIIWLLVVLTVLGFVTLALIVSVENGVKDAKKFRATHEIKIPKQ